MKLDVDNNQYIFLKQAISKSKTSTKRKPWSDCEDEALKIIVETSNLRMKRNYWCFIASIFNTKIVPNLVNNDGRTGKQCRERWKYQLTSKSTSKWTAEENHLLMQYNQAYGNKWKLIASLMLNKSEIDVKNRFLSSFRMKLRVLVKGLILKGYSQLIMTNTAKMLQMMYNVSYIDLSESYIVNRLNLNVPFERTCYGKEENFANSLFMNCSNVSEQYNQNDGSLQTSTNDLMSKNKEYTVSYKEIPELSIEAIPSYTLYSQYDRSLPLIIKDGNKGYFILKTKE